MRFLVAAGLSGALALTGATVAEATTASVAGGPASAVTQPQADVLGNRMDQAFLRMGHEGSLFQIAAGRLAVRKGRCSTVRRLGVEIERDFRKMGREVRMVAERERVLLPRVLPREARVVLRSLAKKSGITFDRAWLRLQAIAHQHAVTFLRMEIRSGKSAEVKHLARIGLPKVRYHLKQVRRALRVC
ncbi:DUF4142 domain-containing protein [Allokutzneria oryzae]|uniref:DUF4142 domain-containing protein n=1 Tax=Allokutzneria oryzae TaxID=1378989 RepID=A0ABV6A734_9PSEU